MSQLTITDLSVTEELGRQAMAAVRGGHGRHGHPPYGKAYGYYGMRFAEGEPGGYRPAGNLSQVAQAGQSIININGNLTDVSFTNTVSAGDVTASATNNVM